MTKITAGDLHYRLLNQEIRLSKDKDIVIENCLGQRFIGSGCIGKNIEIHGVPGNALAHTLPSPISPFTATLRTQRVIP